MDKYRIYNETKGQFEEVISDQLPMVCPENPGDIMRAGSQTIIEANVLYNDGTTKQLTLSNYKALRFNEIDRRTVELIHLGYSFGGKQFPLSANAQTNILALQVTKDDPALVYPIEYNTIDDLESYSIPNAATVHGMYLTALATKKASLDSGTALKDQIRAAVNEAEVNAVIDNR